jgi:hypothetical protein
LLDDGAPEKFSSRTVSPDAKNALHQNGAGVPKVQG